MTESGAKIVIRGDAKHLVDQAKKGEEAIDKIGKKGASAAEMIGKMGDQLHKAVVKAVALQAALSAVEQVAKRQAATAEGSRNAGKTVVERDLAAMKLGLSPQQAAALTTPGAQSREDLTGFLGDLASGDTAKFLGPQGVFRAQALFASGLFGKDEVLTAAKEGRLDGLFSEASIRQGKMTPELATELATRREENMLRAREQDALSANGLGNRLAEQRIATRNAENPGAAGFQGAVTDTLGALPIVGRGVQAVVRTVDTAINNQTEELKRDSYRPAAVGVTR